MPETPVGADAPAAERGVRRGGPAAAQRARAIRLLILDVDGVLTDGRLYYGPDGAEIKAFHAQDGSAMKMLMGAGIPIAIVTGRRSEAVQRRARELGVAWLYDGVADKARALESLCAESGVAPEHMAHVGDDIADLALFDRVGMSFSVPDAHPMVAAAAHCVTERPGGAGAVREVCDLILHAQGKWTEALRSSL